MASVTKTKEKKDLDTPVQLSHSDSTRGVKRSAEEGENEKTGETNTEKRGRRNEKEKGNELDEESEKELIDEQQESRDSAHSETSFMDLPDDIHLNIFSFLDLPSSLKLRLNKRLDRLQSSVKYKMKRVNFEIRAGSFPSELTLHNRTRVGSVRRNFTRWILRLQRLAVNTFVDKITIEWNTALNVQHCRLIDALFHFKSHCLRMSVCLGRRGAGHAYIPHLTLPYFLTLAQNVRRVCIEEPCISLTAQDLCTIRQTIFEGNVMDSFRMEWRRRMKNAFLKACFGVIIENVPGPIRGKIYRSTDESLEIYRQLNSCGGRDLDHFEGDLKTSIYYYGISFKKLKEVEKPDDQFKIKWNHMYRDEPDYNDWSDCD